MERIAPNAALDGGGLWLELNDDAVVHLSGVDIIDNAPDPILLVTTLFSVNYTAGLATTWSCSPTRCN